jgi:ATP adenylyltransferase
MEFIWSPWRMEYIQDDRQSDDCIFCLALGKTDNSENLIIARGESVFTILNRYPYTSGHVMVVPIIHEPTFENLDESTSAELMLFTQKMIRILKNLYKPHGFNVGFNIGEAAGAGILGHVHMHIVPRWIGDTNFMSTLATTRVLPESLEKTYLKIQNSWNHEYQ